ncbi:MAG TPA: hypothetical protein VJV78_23625 [Polyangiales bacterium]|nr:hypothetical protein [Polyangiales bacterium]
MEDIDKLLNNVLPLEDNQGAYEGLLGDLQCGILTGHRKPRARHFFIRFRGDAASLRGLALPDSLKEFQPTSEWAHRLALSQQGEQPRFGVTIMLSSKGYEKLGLEAPDDPAFRAGMAARGKLLNDSVPIAWERGYREEIHALVVVAYGTRGAQTSAEDEKALAELAEFIDTHAKLVWEEDGMELRQGEGKQAYSIEPFGYRDDISQPVFYVSDLKARAAIEGRAADPKGGKWRSFEPLRVALRKDPHGAGAVSCGSYFVFRKLRQDVEGFYAQAEKLAASLNRKNDWAAVADGFVGRQPDGTPLVDAPNLNDFDYRGASAAGCPAHAHVRKVNSRDPAYRAHEHRVARRGIPYGPELKRDEKGRPVRAKGRLQFKNKAQRKADVGLLFMCAQGSIEEQFEHLQRRWSNNTKGGADAINGQLPDGQEHQIAIAYKPPPGSKAKELFSRGLDQTLKPVVELRGGEYFFAPSLSFLHGLTRKLLQEV